MKYHFVFILLIIFSTCSFGDSKLSGFVNYVSINTNNNIYFGDKLVELGLNYYYDINTNFYLSGQLISRKLGSYYNFFPINLDYAILGYNKKDLNVQLGRFKLPIGFYNATRDIFSTKSGIILPSVYNENDRSLTSSADGIIFYNNKKLKNNFLLENSFGLGYPIIDDYVISREFFLGNNITLDFKSKLSYIFYFKFYKNNEDFVIKFTKTNNGFKYKNFIDFSIDYNMLSLKYNLTLNDIFTFEYSKIYLNNNKIDRATSIIYYFQYEKLFNNLVFLIRYENNKNILNNTKSYVFGLKYIFDNNITLQIQYQKNDGFSILPLWENNLNKIVKEWDMFLIGIGYMF